MNDPLFLSVEDVEKLHAMSLELFGGGEGIRDRNAFEAAVYHPQNVYYYAGGDVFDIAAAYCFHIAEAQAFVDGNKRTAAAAAIIFLEGNGHPFTGDNMKLYEAIIAVADNRMDKSGLAALFKELTR